LSQFSNNRRCTNEEKRINEPGSVVQGKKRDTGKSIRDKIDTRNKDDKNFVEYNKEVQAVEKEKITGI
jgi:hypothetical protein